MNDFLNKTYTEINDNIKFSEAKNAALITLNSALISACSSKVFDTDIAFLWRVLIALITLLLIVPLSLSVFSFVAKTDSEDCMTRKINKRIKNHNKISSSPKKYMFYSFISGHYSENPDQYLKDINTDVFGNNNYRVKEETVEYHLARQIVNLSDVAYRKFALFNIAVKIECIIFSAGGVGALAIVICKLIKYFIQQCK